MAEEKVPRISTARFQVNLDARELEQGVFSDLRDSKSPEYNAFINEVATKKNE